MFLFSQQNLTFYIIEFVYRGQAFFSMERISRGLSRGCISYPECFRSSF